MSSKKMTVGSGAPTFCWVCNKQLQRAPGKGQGLFFFNVVRDAGGAEHRVHGTPCTRMAIADGCKAVDALPLLPSLKRASVTVHYGSSDGYSSKATYSSAYLRRDGEKVEPKVVLIDALEELSRLTALFGYGAEAQEAFVGARQRVAEHFAKMGVQR